MSEMTRAEFMAKYGAEKVKFSSYYKYTFTFTGQLANGSTLIVQVGGTHDAIYRQEVAAESDEFVSELYPYAGSVLRDGQEVESFYDF